MGAIYKETDYCESILLVYCSDNDTPDTFFPADPRLVQAHRDSQNEPKQPPTPPVSPVSGITTPSTTAIPGDIWEQDRSQTPSPTFDIPMFNDMAITENDKNRIIESQMNVQVDSPTHHEVGQNNNDVSPKKSVSFALTIEFIEYRKYSPPKRAGFFNNRTKNLNSKISLPKRLFWRNQKIGQSEMKACHGCYICEVKIDKRPLLVETCQNTGFASEARNKISSMFRRVRKLSSRIFFT
ncbi:hypothetical protein L5515_019362 [Caenorhabditis briggsae]|uniref:Uncharacterized protein n=1 Tax=Caenorhabditis briggsae TaxID=6238 RepID=A0AAE9FE30_CAEBR|nr:hypothetical protein L5515_019362 [Caenorhabditis briggsae]